MLHKSILRHMSCRLLLVVVVVVAVVAIAVVVVVVVVVRNMLVRASCRS